MYLAPDDVGQVRQRRIVGVIVDGVDGRRLRGRRRRRFGDRRVVGGDVKALESDRLERPLHVRIAVEHRVKVFDGQREEVTVGVGTNARDATSVHQQTDLCVTHAYTHTQTQLVLTK